MAKYADIFEKYGVTNAEAVQLLNFLPTKEVELHLVCVHAHMCSCTHTYQMNYLEMISQLTFGLVDRKLFPETLGRDDLSTFDRPSSGPWFFTSLVDQLRLARKYLNESDQYFELP